MYQRILVAIDFSEPSIEAARWAVSRFPSAEITLFHALDPGPPPKYLLRAFGERLDLAPERELDARSNLEQVAENLGVTASLVIREGWPPAEARAAATEAEAELIVVGAHRKRVSPWDEPGATAEGIVKASEVPAMVWRPVQHHRDKTVLAALDLREGSAPVAPTAARYAMYFKTRLLLLHVLPRTYQAYLRAVSTPAKAAESLRAIEEAARVAALGRVPEELRAGLDLRARVTRGRPITQILAAAEAEAADLIVAGQSHAPDFPGPPLLGGVTGRLIRGANCSVLCVPAEAEAA
ncbi:MAG: universal stress protein [Gemmatimonadota bacterium]